MEIPNNKILFLVYLVLFEFAVYMSNDMILPALIDVANEFHQPHSIIPLSLSIFLFGSLSIQLFIGPISDKIGRRPIMFIGGIIVLLGNILGVFASNIYVFYIGRILQGMGPCFIGVAGYACVHELYKEKEAIKVISWMASVALLAPMIGPLLGSVVVYFTGWRYIFATTFILSFIGIIGLWYYMPETLVKDKNIKILLIFKNYKTLLNNKKFILGSISFGLSFGSLMVWISSSPVVLIKLFNLNKTEFSLVQIPIFLSFILGTFFLRYLSRFISSDNSLIIGIGISFIASISLFLCSAFLSNNLYLLIINFSIYNIGYGLFSAPFTRIILDSTENSKGISSAMLYFLFFLIGSSTSAAFGIFYKNTLASFTFYIFLITLFSIIFFIFMKKSEKINAEV